MSDVNDVAVRLPGVDARRDPLVTAAAVVQHLRRVPLLPLELRPQSWHAAEVRNAYPNYRLGSGAPGPGRDDIAPTRPAGFNQPQQQYIDRNSSASRSCGIRWSATYTPENGRPSTASPHYQGPTFAVVARSAAVPELLDGIRGTPGSSTPRSDDAVGANGHPSSTSRRPVSSRRRRPAGRGCSIA